MRKHIALTGLAFLLVASPAPAVRIGFFPGLDELIQKADAIVILRVDRHVTDFGSPTLYSTHDCYIYQTLKGDIPTNKTIRLQLMDTRSSFVTPYAIHSTHLMFLTKKRTDNEPTEYRTIEFRGANIRLTPFGHEKMPDGKTVRDQIISLLKETAADNQKQLEKEQAFLNQMIRGTAEPTEQSEANARQIPIPGSAETRGLLDWLPTDNQTVPKHRAAAVKKLEAFFSAAEPVRSR